MRPPLPSPRHLVALAAFGLATAFSLQTAALAQSGGSSQMKWAATWSSAMQGTATLAGSAFSTAYNQQQDLSFPFPKLDTDGANNQTFRNLVKPDLWGNTMRFRFSNTFGTKPVTLGPVRVGLQEYSGVVMDGTNTPVTFNGGSANVTIPVGQEVWSDAVTLSWVKSPDDILVQGRNLAVSFAVQGTSGPMTRHNTAFQYNFISAPGSGDHTNENLDFSYPFATTSWFFLSAVDVMAPSNTQVVCAFGASITDGTFSSLSTNDRWSNFLSRRLHEAYGNGVSVVNEGIGGNRVVTPGGAGPTAVDRLDRDVLGLSGLTSVVWSEGTNDIAGGATPDAVNAGYASVANRLHARNVRLVMGTLNSSFNPTQNYANSALGTTAGPLYGSPDAFAKVQTIDNYVRTANLFDGVVDFYAATIDPATFAMRAQYTISSTDFASQDYLHPNRAGYLAMANAVPLDALAPHASFFAGENPLGANGVNYLTFPNGTPFGYYAYLANSPGFIYHFDLGYEYVIDAGGGNIYLYDFASGGFFYTGATLFPYLYDFTLGTFLYYLPDTSRPGHYTTNPRQFFNFKTNSIITK